MAQSAHTAAVYHHTLISPERQSLADKIRSSAGDVQRGDGPERTELADEREATGGRK